MAKKHKEVTPEVVESPKLAKSKTPDEIKQVMGLLMSKMAVARNEKERLSISIAFMTLGWAIYGGTNPLEVILEKTGWDTVVPEEKISNVGH
jgi:hypothetical protein